MRDIFFYLLIFLLLLGIEGIFNYLAGLWSIFWVPIEIVFDLIFFLFIVFLAISGRGTGGRTVRE
ncbi:MAG: hypothetical protein QW292_06530 [Candidatus Parvarchaeota archaeon]